MRLVPRDRKIENTVSLILLLKPIFPEAAPWRICRYLISASTRPFLRDRYTVKQEVSSCIGGGGGGGSAGTRILFPGNILIIPGQGEFGK